jgi:hypothetical protein
MQLVKSIMCARVTCAHENNSCKASKKPNWLRFLTVKVAASPAAYSQHQYQGSVLATMHIISTAWRKTQCCYCSAQPSDIEGVYVHCECHPLMGSGDRETC